MYRGKYFNKHNRNNRQYSTDVSYRLYQEIFDDENSDNVPDDELFKSNELDHNGYTDKKRYEKKESKYPVNVDTDNVEIDIEGDEKKEENGKNPMRSVWDDLSLSSDNILDSKVNMQDSNVYGQDKKKDLDQITNVLDDLSLSSNDNLQESNVNMQESNVNMQESNVNVQESIFNLYDSNVNMQQSNVNMHDSSTNTHDSTQQSNDDVQEDNVRSVCTHDKNEENVLCTIKIEKDDEEMIGNGLKLFNVELTKKEKEKIELEQEIIDLRNKLSRVEQQNLDLHIELNKQREKSIFDSKSNSTPQLSGNTRDSVLIEVNNEAWILVDK